MAKAKIGIIGDGNVGGALRSGLEKAGYPVRAVGKDPAKISETGVWAEVVMLAVPFPAVDSALKSLGDSVAGKTLVDVTNALTEDMQLALGFTTSGAEELQKKAPRAKVVKAFNTQFAGHMSTGKEGDQTLTIFAAADDEAARKQVLELGRDIGFDAVDAGPLKNARMLESLGYLNITLGYVLGLGTKVGFKLVR